MKVVVDSSAILAILFAESDRDEILKAICENECIMSVGNYLETSIVVDSTRDPYVIRKFDELMKDALIEIVPSDLRQVRLGREAYRDFGRGSGHLAKLNFGDMFAYALASTTKRKLLCKGTDFRRTNIAIFDYLPAE